MMTHENLVKVLLIYFYQLHTPIAHSLILSGILKNCYIQYPKVYQKRGRSAKDIYLKIKAYMNK